ncbi:MAG: ATP-binding protein [Planctomycetota bacterium]|nr:ATP-binding protein [Planctomycetota bacterium]
MTRIWTGTSAPQRRPRLLWRIVLPFAAGGLLLLTVGAVAAWYVVRLQESASDILAWNVSSIRAAEELELVIRETRYRLNQYLLTGDPAHLGEAVALRESTEQWIDEAHRLSSMPEEEQLAKQLRAGFRRFLQESERLVEGDADPEVVRHLARDILPDEVLRPARLYLDLNEQHLARSSEENQTMAERLGIGLLLLGLCGAVAGLVSGYGLARGVSRSILQLSLPMRDVAGQLGSVLGPVTLSADPQVEDLEGLLQVVSERVATVITQLQESQRTAMRAEQLASLGQFAAGLAHELRNPLMSMKILVQTAMESGAAAAMSGRDLSILDEEITRLEQLVQGFLDFARPPEAVRHSINLADVATSTVNLVTPQAGRRGVSVTCDVSDDVPPVNADSGQLRQVVLNLLLNAIEATPTGGTVSIHGECLNDFAVLRVTDAGAGLPEELGDSIFEPFVSSRETGIGLGLSICRRIVETHQGTITAQDRLAGGAEFTVRIPVAAAP